MRVLAIPSFCSYTICLQTGSPKINKEIHFWARMAISSNAFYFFLAETGHFTNIRYIYRQNYTSVYSFDYEFRVTAKHRFWLIRAASMPLLKILNVSEPPRMAVVPSRSDFCKAKTRRQCAQGWAWDRSETSLGTKLVLNRCTWTDIGTDVRLLTMYLYHLFAKALAMQNRRPPWWIGTGFIYHSCSTFQFLIVRIASSNPAPMSTTFFPSALYCAA